MWRDKMLLAISFAVFAAYVGNTMIVPVRVLYAEKEGASLTVISAMATAFLVSNFLFQYPMGWIADRWGRKRLMLIGLIAQATISLLYLALADPFAFVGLRFLEGIASATMLSPARAMIADIILPEKRGEAYGVFNSFFNASWVLGPGIGSLLASWSYESVFVAAFVTRLIACGLVFFVLFEPSHVLRDASIPRRKLSARDLFTLPLVGAYVLVLSDYMYIGFDQTLFPLWMQDHLGATVALIGLTYITWGLPPTLLSTFGGKLADRIRRSTLILA
ncbi:MAG: MFS transporter, partial [Chloroflexia bacterium]